jgi:nitrate/nitrite-specific signal transduction histidine kinase
LLDYFYYSALTVAALYENATADQRTAWHELLTVHREQLGEWADKDNGAGISRASLAKSDGFGLRNMRTRASQMDGKLDIHGAAGHGTTIVPTVPIPS